MQHLLFLSTTSLLAVASLGGCSDDAACGPGNAQDAGLLASSADVVLNFTNLTSGPNNDCPDGTAPSGVTSLTIQGTQLEGNGLITLCIPRPDLLTKGPLQFGTDVRIIDLSGNDMAGCNYDIERLRPLTGSASATGLCDNGASSAGFALTVNGALSLTRTCMTANDTIAVTFTGTVAIAGPP